MTTSVPPPGGRLPAWQSQPPQSDPPPSAGSGLTDLSRRLLALAGLLSVVLIAVVVQAALSGDEDASFNPMARAAEKTKLTSGMKFEITGSLVSDNLPSAMLIKGEGVYNGGLEAFGEKGTFEVPGRPPVTIEGVTTSSHLYLRSVQFQDRLPAGKSWLGISWDASAVESEESAGKSEADKVLKLLRAAPHGVENLGRIEVRGRMTTAYRAKINFDKLEDRLRSEGDSKSADEIENLGAEPLVTAWISDDDIVRRTRTITEFQSADGKTATLDLQCDFFDFGITPDVEIPHSDEVFEDQQPSDSSGANSPA